MNREEAEKVLGLVRTVIQNTREDLVAHNWGLIWIVHAFTNLAACWAGAWIDLHDPTVLEYLVPFAVVAVVDILVVVFLITRDHGVRSYVEWQLHGIWWSFVVFTVAGAVALWLYDAPPQMFAPLFALTSGFSFAMMAVVFSRQLPFAILFVAILLVGPLIKQPGLEWVLIGIAWWGAMFFPGLSMHREKLRRGADATTTRIL